MEKTKIKIIKLGKTKHDKAFKKLKRYRSAIFDVYVYEKDMPNFDLKFGHSDGLLKNKIASDFDDREYHMCIGVTEERLELDFLGKLLKNDNMYVITFYQVDEFLKEDNNDSFNYLLLMIYRFLTQYKLKGKSIAHDQSCGCIFDKCRNKKNIIYSCQHPIVCSKCISQINTIGIQDDYLLLLQKEIKSIHKIFYYRITEYINKHPYLSIILLIIFSILLNAVSSLTYDLIKALIFK